MKQREANLLGMTGTQLVPESADEFDKNAKKAGACVDEAVKNVWYRSNAADIRSTFIHGADEVKDGDKVVTPAFKGVEETFGYDRKTKVTQGKGDKQIESFAETEEQYIDRVRAQLVKDGKAKDEAGATALLQPIYTQALALCPFDASATERKAGPAKLAKTWIESALNFLRGNKTADGKKTYKLENAVKAIKADLQKDFIKTGDEAKDSTTLGWLLKDWHAAQDKKAQLAREASMAA